ncbi:MAG: cytochrome c [Burkholderiales bacterium]|nr:MAG: cytochrome c [Burkholderiales bacterium]
MPTPVAATRCGLELRRFARALGCGAGLLLALLAGGAQAAAGDDEAGRKLFTEVAKPPCGLCHVLAAAGTTGRIGPSLDELKPDADRVARAVKQGVGVMPPFEESLTDEQIAAIARYVARASGGAK